MTYLAAAAPLRFACHDQEPQPSTNHARSHSDNNKNNAMTSIDYNQTEHSDVPVQEVLDYIQEHASSIEHVSCSGTLDTDSVRELCRVLLKNPAHTNVETLSLPRNELSLPAAEALAKLLYNNTTIHSLDLHVNKLGPDGTQTLVQPLISSANSTLMCLNLTHNALGPNSASSIASLLKHTTSLRTLKLGHNHLGRKGIKTLAHQLSACRSLKTLSLSHNQMGPQGIHLLAKELEQQKSSLVYLDITCNRAGTRGTRDIANWLYHNKTLQTLLIGSNDCDSTGAVAIASLLRFNHTLKHVHMGGNQVGDAGAEAIAKELQQSNRSLETLHLDWNHISDQGGIALGEALMHNSSLVSLDLSGNHIADIGGIALAKALPYNPRLKHLNISRNQLQDSTAEAFAETLVGVNRVLHTLEYDENQISDCGRDRITQAFRYRKNFQIWFGPLLQQQLSRTTSLDLCTRNVGDEEVIALADRLNTTASPLQALYIGGNLVTARGISHFAKKYLANSESCRLVRLYVRSSRIGNEGAKAISVALTTNTSLRVLSLTSSGITLVGAEVLGSALQENGTLHSLNLDGNKLGDQGLESLVNGLKSSTSLTALSVANNGITDKGVVLIASTRFKDVNLSGNKVTDGGAIDLARALLDDCPFTRLNLAGNQLTARRGEALRAFLPPTTTFEYI